MLGWALWVSYSDQLARLGPAAALLHALVPSSLAAIQPFIFGFFANKSAGSVGALYGLSVGVFPRSNGHGDAQERAAKQRASPLVQKNAYMAIITYEG